MQTLVTLVGLFLCQSCFISQFSSQNAHNSNKLRFPYPVRGLSPCFFSDRALQLVCWAVCQWRRSLESDYGLRYLRWWGIVIVFWISQCSSVPFSDRALQLVCWAVCHREKWSRGQRFKKRNVPFRNGTEERGGGGGGLFNAASEVPSTHWRSQARVNAEGTTNSK